MEYVYWLTFLMVSITVVWAVRFLYLDISARLDNDEG